MILSCQNICKAFGEEEIIKDACFHIEEKEKAALIGNNGGDGVAVARLLYLKGYHVDLFLTGNSQKYSAQMAQQIQIARHYHVPEVNNPTWHEYTTIVDAVFGVGLTRPVEGRYKEIIQRMNETDAKKVAVDIPSGLDGSTGRVLGTAFCADLTVTFAFM